MDSSHRRAFALLLVILAAALVRDVRSVGEREALLQQSAALRAKADMLQHQGSSYRYEMEQNQYKIRFLEERLKAYQDAYPEPQSLKQERQRMMDAGLIVPDAILQGKEYP